MVTAHPISPRHTHLLAAYLALRFDLPALAAQESLSATEIIDFFQAIQPHLQDLRKALQDSLELQSLSAKSAALHTLETLTKSSENPFEQRRAAAHILRGLTRPSEPSDAGGGRRNTPTSHSVLNPQHSALPSRSPALQELLSLLNTDSPTSTSPTHPSIHSPSGSRPNSALNPQHSAPSQATAYQILSAACNPHAPDSAATIHKHLAPGATINDQPAASQADIPPLLSQLSSKNPVREVTLSAPATHPDRPNLHGFSAELTHEDDQVSHLALVLANTNGDNWKLQSLYNDSG